MALFVCVGAGAFPKFEQVRGRWKASDPRLLDRRGKLLQESRRDFSGRRLEWVSLAQVSEAARGAVLSAEDRRFWSHHGVDWRAAVSGALRSAFTSRPRGASTLSMQVVSFLDPSLRPRGRRRGIWRKWQQMQAARDLEKVWTKEQIFETYLNLVTFRSELRGIEAASRALFDKSSHGLTAGEGAVLAALIRSPNASAAKVAERACLITKSACEEIKASPALTAEGRIRPRRALAPHLARLLRGDGDEVRTTLDLEVQAFSLDVLNRYLLSLKEEHVADGAVVVLDNRTGETIAYLGNGDGISQVDGVRARRQAGSSLKPFLYALAFEQRRLTPASLLQDSPLDVPFGRGIYRPANYDNLFRGPVSARRSLAESLNIPAVRALMLVGEEAFAGKLRELGFEGLGEAKKYGPSLALGTADVSLWELTNAFRALANGGTWSPAKLTGIEPETTRKVFGPGPAYLVGDILSDRESRSGTFGLESPLSTRFWSAVKTGTSKDMRDNWCVGFSSEFTVGVWVGNFDGSSMWNVSGASGAAPVWKEIMIRLNEIRPSRKPERPSAVIAKGNENFIDGTEPTPASGKLVSGPPRIGYPVGGSLFAWDPDIPPANQRILFEKRGSGKRLRWSLDGHILGPAEEGYSWLPVPGRHELRLIAANGAELDKVRFEVRGGEIDDVPTPFEQTESP